MMTATLRIVLRIKWNGGRGSALQSTQMWGHWYHFGQGEKSYCAGHTLAGVRVENSQVSPPIPFHKTNIPCCCPWNVPNSCSSFRDVFLTLLFAFPLGLTPVYLVRFNISQRSVFSSHVKELTFSCLIPRLPAAQTTKHTGTQQNKHSLHIPPRAVDKFSFHKINRQAAWSDLCLELSLIHTN